MKKYFFLVTLGVAAFAAAACRLKPEEFAEKLYSCNASAADPACGTDLDDAPMACVPAHQLGGSNFCSSSCDRATDNPEGDATGICLAAGPKNAGRLSGARLAKCDPSAAVPCAQTEMSCLRTDLIKNEGVCTTVSSCKANSDCRDPVRAVCMGELLRETYTKGPDLKADHTYCLQAGCRERRTACSPGETCMRDVLPRESYPPDICVPNCDANHNCPPNYFCYPDVYSRVSPPICIPGLMGLRCRTRMDCLFGDCKETGAGFNVCTVSCADDNDCAKFDSIHGTFFCNDQKLCAGPRAFRGSLCYANDDCHTGEICARLAADSRSGQCLFPCGADGRCPVAYGGVPHTCLPQIALAGGKVCWPGSFAQYCDPSVTDQCIRPLSCRKVPGSYPACTILCESDDDCQKERVTRDGWCLKTEATSVCVAPRKDDAACDRDVQCESKKCISDIQKPGQFKCDKTPGY